MATTEPEMTGIGGDSPRFSPRSARPRRRKRSGERGKRDKRITGDRSNARKPRGANPSWPAQASPDRAGIHSFAFRGEKG